MLRKYTELILQRWLSFPHISWHFIRFIIQFVTPLTEACLDARRPPPPKAPRMSDENAAKKSYAETRKSRNFRFTWHQWGQRKTPGENDVRLWQLHWFCADDKLRWILRFFVWQPLLSRAMCAKGKPCETEACISCISKLLHVIQVLDDGSNVYIIQSE